MRITLEMTDETYKLFEYVGGKQMYDADEFIKEFWEMTLRKFRRENIKEYYEWMKKEKT